jgi:hypothetical protein
VDLYVHSPIRLHEKDNFTFFFFYLTSYTFNTTCFPGETFVLKQSVMDAQFPHTLLLTRTEANKTNGSEKRIRVLFLCVVPCDPSSGVPLCDLFHVKPVNVKMSKATSVFSETK